MKVIHLQHGWGWGVNPLPNGDCQLVFGDENETERIVYQIGREEKKEMARDLLGLKVVAIEPDAS